MLTATTKPCRDCRDWNDCPGKAWYEPKDIIYCRHQVIWIVQQFLEYTAGDISIGRETWPAEDKETGYTDVPSNTKNTPGHAPYELLLLIVGEVTSRLKATGVDGRMLVLEILNAQIALGTEARNALNYCSGWTRKGNYQRWLKQRAYRSKMNTKRYS